MSEENTPLDDAERIPAATDPGVERVSGWAQYPWLRAGFSTRHGGQSMVYGPNEQNLGWTPEDEEQIVQGNRHRFAQAVSGGANLYLVTSHQVHGPLIRDLETEDSMTVEGKAKVRADGMLSRQPGRLLAILTADCVPVLVADRRTHAVAAFHAGWRGTLARIVEQGIGSMRTRYGSDSGDLIAAIGPAIGACCYAVGDEVRQGFESQFTYAPALLSATHDAAREPQVFLNLAEANRRQLLEAGLAPENITTLAECTACSRLADGRRKYYSHRDEHGIAGRMLSAIGAVPA